jgi:hypothetical protein
MNRYFGVYRGVVTGGGDPLGQGRVMVAIPSVLAAAPSWAAVAAPFGPVSGEPQVGSPVWVMFEAGDLASPVVIGKAR